MIVPVVIPRMFTHLNAIVSILERSAAASGLKKKHCQHREDEMTSFIYLLNERLYAVLTSGLSFGVPLSFAIHMIGI